MRFFTTDARAPDENKNIYKSVENSYNEYDPMIQSEDLNSAVDEEFKSCIKLDTNIINIKDLDSGPDSDADDLKDIENLQDGIIGHAIGNTDTSYKRRGLCRKIYSACRKCRIYCFDGPNSRNMRIDDIEFHNFSDDNSCSCNMCGYGDTLCLDFGTANICGIKIRIHQQFYLTAFIIGILLFITLSMLSPGVYILYTTKKIMIREIFKFYSSAGVQNVSTFEYYNNLSRAGRTTHELTSWIAYNDIKHIPEFSWHKVVENDKLCRDLTYNNINTIYALDILRSGYEVGYLISSYEQPGCETKNAMNMAPMTANIYLDVKKYEEHIRCLYKNSNLNVLTFLRDFILINDIYIPNTIIKIILLDDMYTNYMVFSQNITEVNSGVQSAKFERDNDKIAVFGGDIEYVIKKYRLPIRLTPYYV